MPIDFIHDCTLVLYKQLIQTGFGCYPSDFTLCRDFLSTWTQILGFGANEAQHKAAHFFTVSLLDSVGTHLSKGSTVPPPLLWPPISCHPTFTEGTVMVQILTTPCHNPGLSRSHQLCFQRLEHRAMASKTLGITFSCVILNS